MIAVRPERDEHDIVRAVHEAAFETDIEARLVDRLRADGDVLLSLVALKEEMIVGNLILSPMAAEADGAPLQAAAIGPFAVLPGRQGEGIGSRLMQVGIEWTKEQGFTALFLLGEPGFYRRFGFSAKNAAPFASPYAGEYWQMLPLDDAFTLPKSGQAAYAPAFAALEHTR